MAEIQCSQTVEIFFAMLSSGEAAEVMANFLDPNLRAIYGTDTPLWYE